MDCVLNLLLGEDDELDRGQVERALSKAMRRAPIVEMRAVRSALGTLAARERDLGYALRDRAGLAVLAAKRCRR